MYFYITTLQIRGCLRIFTLPFIFFNLLFTESEVWTATEGEVKVNFICS